jgi:tetratricopeptide (TPR) repeat protein
VSISSGQTADPTQDANLATPEPTISAEQKARAILDELEGAEPSDDTYAKARVSILNLFDQVIATTPLNERLISRVATGGSSQQAALSRYVTIAAHARLISQLARCSPEVRRLSLTNLRKHPAVLEAIVFATDLDHDKPEAAYSLLNQIVERYPNEVDSCASLAAAVCVVHDVPLVQRANENTAHAADPLLIFDYFARNRRRLAIDPSTLPTELLEHVVDTTATIEEMEWALARYATNATVGDRYTEVKYDTEAFTRGVPKKCVIAPGGWNLQNIRQYGGVCVDQTYFACMVGKAQGIPTAFVTGRSSSLGHAWLGFLKQQGGRPNWDFSTGRYNEFRSVRGTVVDSHTGLTVSDGHIGILADFLSQPKEARIQSLALVDAAARTALLQKAGTLGPSADAAPKATSSPKPFSPDFDSRQRLLEAALRRAPANIVGWSELAKLARDGGLTYADKARWADVLFSLCGSDFADFSLEMLRPMIESQSDPIEQSRLWDAAFKTYKHRPDLACDIRLAQGEMWETAGEKAKAWDAYQDILRLFPNEGSGAVAAAQHLESLLRANGKVADILPMYEAAFAKAAKPKRGAPEFLAASNWFRLGVLYAQSLAGVGRTQDAERVIASLGIDPARLRKK